RGSAGGGGAKWQRGAPHPEETLKTVREGLADPSCPPAEFEELKRAMLVGAEGRRGDPSAIADEQLSRYLNPYPPGHWNYPLTTDETVAALKTAKLDDAKRCYSDLVGATGAQLVAIGDFDPEALMRQIEALFGDWKSPSPYKRIPSRFFARDPLERTVLTPDKANAVLRGGLNIELRDDN